MDKIHFLKHKKSSQRINQLSPYDRGDKQYNQKIYKVKTESNSVRKTLPLSMKKQCKSRKDHSIQVKSPIKIPNRNEQVTFRRYYTSEFDDKMQTPKVETKNITIQQIAIINQMWKNSCKLKQKKIYEDMIDKIQIILKEMITQVGQSLFLRQQDPDGKTISINCQTNKNIKKTKKISYELFPTEQIRQNLDENKKQKYFQNSALQTTQQLQFKKIMYMLDDQSRLSKNSKIFLQQSDKSNKSFQNFLQSLSSFNQNSTNQQSGYTIEQIQKQSGIQSIFDEFQSCTSQDIEQKRRTDRKNHKRQVLKDIVSMLNKKYNKNIQIQ